MKKAVLLMTMGGPASLNEVHPFLFRLFNDPFILRIPIFFRWPLAALIALLRAPKAREIYKSMGGGSPIRENTQSQAKALEEKLGADYACFIGMSYARPLIHEAVEGIKKSGAEKIVLLPLYPQFSTTTTLSALTVAKREIKKTIGGIEIAEIRSFHLVDGFLEAFAEGIKKEREKAIPFGEPKILFSAHGLPEKTVARGDVYPCACRQTKEALMKSLSLPDEDCVLCYQSRVGPVKWIGPSTEEEVKKAARAKKPVILVPLSFVSEHAETLVELDRDYRSLALLNGAPYFGRVLTPSCHQQFISGLARLVLEK